MQYFFSTDKCKSFESRKKIGLNHPPSKQCLKQYAQEIISKQFNALSQQALTVFAE